MRRLDSLFLSVTPALLMVWGWFAPNQEIFARLRYGIYISFAIWGIAAIFGIFLAFTLKSKIAKALSAISALANIVVLLFVYVMVGLAVSH